MMYNLNNNNLLNILELIFLIIILNFLLVQKSLEYKIHLDELLTKTIEFFDNEIKIIILN